MATCQAKTPALATTPKPPSTTAAHRKEDGNTPQKDGTNPGTDGTNPGTDGTNPGTDGTNPGTDGSNPAKDGSVPPQDFGCINQCSLNARQCSAGGGWQKCEMQANGCTAWGNETACKSGEICSGGQCMRNCINQCSIGARMCQGNGYVVCETKTTGCTDWGSVSPCGSGTVCSGGQCVKNCTNQCTQGIKQCAPGGVQTCELNATTGCTEWGNPIACPTGAICSGGSCMTNCSNQCTDGAVRCNGPNEQTCSVQASGCTDWDTPKPCATGSCVNGKCDSGVCVSGDRRCNGTSVEQCDQGGFWITLQICPQACNQGTCTTSVTCSPVTRRCNNDVVEECNPTGTAWLYLESCQNGCQGGLCSGGCTPGASRCNGETVETCKQDGSGWATGTTCSTFCYKGDCAQLNLLLDNQTTTLDGEQVYAGDVVLKNNSRINIGPKGWLRIRAANITVDATSSIEAPAVGNDPSGEGADRGTYSCRYSGCSRSVSGTATASGGGYGTAGGNGTGSSTYNCYYGTNRYCTPSSPGGKANDAYVSHIHMGSSGGSCTTANGGGMIDLIAETKLDVAGNLTANGGAGAGNCAGGSGGGIRLVAEAVSVTGIISVAGGSPRGGQGRIKILHGSQHTVSGTFTGVVEQSFLPPLELLSSTHPDATLTYNDDFASFNISWTRPYSNNAGYYYDVNTSLPTSQSHVPDSQSTWLTTESQTFQPSALKTGTNYFHVVPFSAGATIGTIESNFKVNINSTPPTIASSSHPTSSQWFDLPTAVFTWTDPIAEKNFTRYYFVFDRFADTIPTKADSKLPVGTKTTYKPNLPAGSIWYLHVISEDTMGYLTKQARHFRIQVGPDPGLGGISGSIKDAKSNQPIDGVKITLNRGYKSTTSAGNGSYFFSNNVPATVNDYELKAEKTGYATYTAQVKVSQGQNTSLNILLTPTTTSP
jgi:hypothetical protein